MEKPCLNNKDEYPGDEVLSRYLGEVKSTWDSFNEFLDEKNNCSVLHLAFQYN